MEDAYGRYTVLGQGNGRLLFSLCYMEVFIMKKIILPIVLVGMVGSPLSAMGDSGFSLNAFFDATEEILKKHLLSAASEGTSKFVKQVGEYDEKGILGDVVRRLKADGALRGGSYQPEAYIPMLAYTRSIKLVQDRILDECALSGGGLEEHLNELHEKAALKGKGMLGDFQKYLLKKYSYDYAPETFGQKCREFFGGKRRRWSVNFLLGRLKELSRSAFDKFSRKALRAGGRETLIVKFAREAKNEGRDFVAYVELKYGNYSNDIDDIGTNN